MARQHGAILSHYHTKSGDSLELLYPGEMSAEVRKSIDFDDFTSPFTLTFLTRLIRYIKLSTQCFIGYPNTSNLIKKYSAARRIFNSLLGV